MTDDAQTTPIPDMSPVTSSNVESIGHDADANELHVRFRNGGHYVFAGVDADFAANITSADSIGKMIHRTLKSCGFKARKLK